MADPRARFVLSAEDRTARAFSGVRRSLGGIGRRVGALTRDFAALLGVAGGAAIGKSILDQGDRIGRLVARLGGTPEFFSRVGYAAEQSGVSFDTLAMGAQRMTRRLGEASRGTGEALKALEAMRLDPKKLGAMGLEDQFMTVMSVLDQIPNQSTRAAMAVKLFDSEGLALVQMLDGGIGAVKRYMAEADALGLTFTKEGTDKAIKFSEALGRLQGTMRGFAQEATLEFAPQLTQAFDAMRTALPEIKVMLEGLFGVIGDVTRVAAQLVAAAGQFDAATGRGSGARSGGLVGLGERVMGLGLGGLGGVNLAGPLGNLIGTAAVQTVKDPDNPEIIKTLKQLLDAFRTDRLAVAG